MKKIYITIAVLMFFGSCKKDVLDITPTDRLSENAIWTDITLPQLFVNAQYNAIQHGLDFNQGITYYGDEAYNQYNYGAYHAIGLNQVNPSNVGGVSTYYNYWGTGYSYLRNLNIFFSKIEGTPIAADAKNRLIAEIKFIRAFIYAKLIWNYGGVPIVEKLYGLSEDLKGLKRNSYDECVNYIVKDLDDAIKILPNQQTGNNLGRASADAARALKTRVLLYYASAQNNPANDKTRWQAASDAALEIISSNRYALSNNYHGLFIGAANTEAIFSRYFSSDNTNIIGKVFAPVGSGGNSFGAPSQNLVDAYEMKNGVIPVINGMVNPDPNNTYDPANPYVNRDPRFYANILYNGAAYKGRTIQPFSGGADGNSQDSSPTGYFNYKFLDENLVVNDRFAYTYPWHHFRLAEIFLNYAEAQYNLGNEANARTYLNRVRARAGVEMPAITATGSSLFDALVHERQVELAFEGQRFYDVRRWKIAPTVEAKPIQGVQVVRNANGTFTYTRFNALNKVWADRLYLIPITFQEIQSSGGSLIQNPGYQ